MKLHRQLCIAFISGMACAAPLLLATPDALAWGDEGHMVVGLIADHYLTANARAQVETILAADSSGLTATDIASEATWADKYRNSHRETASWHFVDTEISDGDIDAACFGHPSLPANTPASGGVAQDCVVDKVDQFSVELRDPATTPAERLLALQFLLHFVGDLHQPLHSSDSHDRGGNDETVSATGIAAGKLHAYWDTAFVNKLGTDQNKVATALIAKISSAQVKQWQNQTPRDWSLEAFDIARTDVYGKLPTPDSSGKYKLPATYVSNAGSVVATQLSRAGVRLAKVLNDALGGSASATSASAVLASPFAGKE
ncbi:S1/P1 Nuclease family protein [Collimonas fungivorans]|uniref:S1/P1 Nuclease family protein n=1 Tax=Collimonas fungivorans TaxID=158899 RepID=A0A127P5K5_9BURK|nr:S1/P1 nuclease [Collimonas fungivorans]AMO92964.1 S1/P1 Nuclease family protein [Collimonas fungivorans]